MGSSSNRKGPSSSNRKVPSSSNRKGPSPLNTKGSDSDRQNLNDTRTTQCNEEYDEEVKERLLNSVITKAYKGIAGKFLINKWGHHFLFLEIDGKSKPNDNGIVLEYGNHYGLFSSFNYNPCYYWKENGMNYSELTHKEFKSYEIIKEYKIKYKNTLRQLIASCWKNNSWEGKDFSWIRHHCQDFAKLALNFLR